MLICIHLSANLIRRMFYSLRKRVFLVNLLKYSFPLIHFNYIYEMGGKNRRRARRHVYYHRATLFEPPKSLEVEIPDTEGPSSHNSSSSWISMSTLPSFDSDEDPETTTGTCKPSTMNLLEHSSEGIILPRISPEDPVIEEKIKEPNISSFDRSRKIVTPTAIGLPFAFPWMSPEEPVIEEQNEKPKVPETDLEPNKLTLRADSMIFLGVIEKLALLLKSGKGGKLTLIFEKIMSLIEDKAPEETDLMYEIMETFMESIENSSVDYLRYFKTQIISKALPKELRSLYVANDSLKDDYIVLGRGGFGQVFRGQLKKPGVPFVTVAIKEVNDQFFNDMFLEEARVMTQFDHDVILKLLAITHKGDNVKLVVEYMENGDLVEAIVQERLHLNPSDVLTIIHDVASGMEYLSNKQYVHRDLKCSNVFVNLRKECKIGDFGLCKYVGDSNGVYEDKKIRLNATHVAPETRETSIFTTKTDIWSMGLLIWELYSLRKTYSSSRDMLKCLYAVSQMWKLFIVSGHLLQVQDCPTELHHYLIWNVLNDNPTERPTFGTLKKKIVDVLKRNHNYISFDN